MALAHASVADEDDVGGLFHEAEPELMSDLVLVDFLRPSEVVLFEGFDDGKLR